jgi:hypothetical protein
LAFKDIKNCSNYLAKKHLVIDNLPPALENCNLGKKSPDGVRKKKKEARSSLLLV